MPEAGFSGPDGSNLRTWREATERALYGANGFYTRVGEGQPDGPAAHFRTSVHASPLFAAALLTLARAAGLKTIVDLGAGRGELLLALHDLDPALRLVGVELAPRPPSLPGRIEWTREPPPGTTGLVVANEWLDNVPIDVVERADGSWRLVLVDPARGREELGPQPGSVDTDWLDAWWPAAPGARAEVGWPRDAAWGRAVASLQRGIAIAVDYGHLRTSRPPGGSLQGHRRGRVVPPVPDGSCDITSHVAVDACALAGRQAGAAWTALVTQREALHALGVRRTAPPPELARADPAGYLRALAEAGGAAELTDPGGLGGFWWLVQGVRVERPQPLTGTDS